MLLLAVARSSLECGNEIWECNKGQAKALVSILLGVLERFLEHVMKLLDGLNTEKSGKDKAKLKWCC